MVSHERKVLQQVFASAHFLIISLQDLIVHVCVDVEALLATLIGAPWSSVATQSRCELGDLGTFLH